MKRIWLLLLIVILSGCRRTMTPAETFDDVIAYPEYTGKTIIEYTEDESTELVEEYTKYLYVGEDIAEIHEQRYYFKYDSTIENVSESFAEAISNYKTMSKTELEASVNENGFTNVSCEYNINDVNIYCIDEAEDTYTVSWNDETYEFTIISTDYISDLNYLMDDLIEEWKYIENVVIYKQ
ncbi:MAG: hypothetical protein IKM20_09265 [Erysipelotrichales bacterium]|nr:hypothetical protein [Erysipelotrichales bacterium]